MTREPDDGALVRSGNNEIDDPFARASFEPGQWVVHPERPDWGVGQVQSAIGRRVTVMFENAGKVMVDAGVVALQLAN